MRLGQKVSASGTVAPGGTLPRAGAMEKGQPWGGGSHAHAAGTSPPLTSITVFVSDAPATTGPKDADVASRYTARPSDAPDTGMSGKGNDWPPAPPLTRATRGARNGASRPPGAKRSATSTTPPGFSVKVVGDIWSEPAAGCGAPRSPPMASSTAAARRERFTTRSERFASAPGAREPKAQPSAPKPDATSSTQGTAVAVAITVTRDAPPLTSNTSASATAPAARGASVTGTSTPSPGASTAAEKGVERPEARPAAAAGSGSSATDTSRAASVLVMRSACVTASGGEPGGPGGVKTSPKESEV
jgi:hypothetical protein